jgi:hypothetical protein
LRSERSAAFENGLSRRVGRLAGGAPNTAPQISVHEISLYFSLIPLHLYPNCTLPAENRCASFASGEPCATTPDQSTPSPLSSAILPPIWPIPGSPSHVRVNHTSQATSRFLGVSVKKPPAQPPSNSQPPLHSARMRLPHSASPGAPPRLPIPPCSPLSPLARNPHKSSHLPPAKSPPTFPSMRHLTPCAPHSVFCLLSSVSFLQPATLRKHGRQRRHGDQPQRTR